MATQTCLHRLRKEYQQLMKNPILNMKIYVNPDNILKWYFCIYNLSEKDNPWYHGGEYYGWIEMHHDYPYKPPSYYMLTPNGRFEIEKSICTTNSSFHMKNWNPLWTLDSLFRGFLSLFLEDNSNQQLSVNHLHTSSHIKKQFALRSKEYNQTHNTKLNSIMDEYEEIIFHPDDRNQSSQSSSRSSSSNLINQPKIKLKMKPLKPF